MALAEVDVNLDRTQSRRLRSLLKRLGANAPRALHRATLTTLRNVRVIIVREVASDVGVPQKAVFRKGSRSNPVQEITFRGSGRWVREGQVVAESVRGDRERGRIRLGRLKARGMKRGGVTYKLGGERRRIADAFIVETGSFRGVFRRGSDGRIFQLYGPSVAHAAANRPRVQRLARTEAGELYLRNVNQQIARFERS